MLKHALGDPKFPQILGGYFLEIGRENENRRDIYLEVAIDTMHTREKACLQNLGAPPPPYAHYARAYGAILYQLSIPPRAHCVHIFS